jgi:hypothetical protein
VKRLPDLQGATLKWLDNYQKGRFELTIDASSLGPHLDRLKVSTERLIAGMILTGMLIGSAMIMALPIQNDIGVYIKLAVFIVFVTAVILGLWLMLRILWRGYREEQRLNRNKNPWK